MFKRRWKTTVVQGGYIAMRCSELTDDGWTVHTLLPIDSVIHEGAVENGARIVAFKDEPDLSGGVPR